MGVEGEGSASWRKGDGRKEKAEKRRRWKGREGSCKWKEGGVRAAAGLWEEARVVTGASEEEFWEAGGVE